jgi:hypothetical protein
VVDSDFWYLWAEKPVPTGRVPSAPSLSRSQHPHHDQGSSHNPKQPKQGRRLHSILDQLEGTEEKEQMKRKNKLMRPKSNHDKLTADDSDFFVVKPVDQDGVLQVRIAEAADLAGGEIFSCDPYVMIECSGVVQKTPIIEGTNAPHWSNAVYEFAISKSDPDSLKIRLKVFDHEMMGSDTLIGHSELDVSDLVTKCPDGMPNYSRTVPAAARTKVHLQSCMIFGFRL